MAPNPRNRDIFQAFPKFDNGIQANYVDGGSNVLDTPVSSAPAGGDQGSTDTLAQRQAEAQAFRAAQRDAGLISGAGAAGTVVAPAGQLVTQGSVPANTFGPADVVAPEGNNLALRSDGADSGTDGTGKAIG